MVTRRSGLGVGLRCAAATTAAVATLGGPFAQEPPTTTPSWLAAKPSEAQRAEAESILSPGERIVRKSLGAAEDGSGGMAYNANLRTVVFVSASMPSDLVEALYRDAGERDDVVFLLRGWKPPDIAASLRPFVVAAQKAGSMAATGFDPQAFTTYRVSAVPVVLHRCKDGGWYRASGIASIERAERAACLRTRERLGDLYPVLEPNILELIKSRAAAMDWDKYVAGARERADRASFAESVALPYRKEPSTRLFDPTVKSAQTVRGANNEVLIAEGASLNPLSVTALTRPIIVFDPRNEAELAAVADWRKAHPDATLLATSLTLADGRSVAETWQTDVWPLNPDLVARLGVNETPTLIKQHGKQLRLTITTR